MHWQQVVDRIVEQIEHEPSIEGAFLGGSLVTEAWDEFSDIDLGIATTNSPEDLAQAYALRYRIATAVGEPVHSLERAWNHSKMMALLYSRNQFPPIGFELDVFFSQLRHVCELMPGANFAAVFDRSGRLEQELEKLGRARRKTEVRGELEHQLVAFPFDTNHAVKAHARGDLFNFQFVVERMRAAIFSAAASRQGTVVRGSKRASRYLEADEREAIQRSYCEFSYDSIRELTELYVALLKEVEGQYGMEEEVESLRKALPKII